jgi:hypothetical protein
MADFMVCYQGEKKINMVMKLQSLLIHDAFFRNVKRLIYLQGKKIIADQCEILIGVLRVGIVPLTCRLYYEREHELQSILTHMFLMVALTLQTDSEVYRLWGFAKRKISLNGSLTNKVYLLTSYLTELQ